MAAKKPGAKLQVMVKYPIPTMYVGETVNDVNAYLNEIGIDLEALARNKNIIISRMSRASEYQPLAAVFTSLPAEHFETVYDKDGVVLRSLVSQGKCWTYLVNTSEYPRKISIAFTGKGKLQRLGLVSEIQKVPSSGIVTLTIKPYDIAAWKGTAGLVPHSFHHLR